MKRISVLAASIIIGWFVISVAIVLLGFLFVQEESRSEYFLYRLIWTEVLLGMVCASGTMAIWAAENGTDPVSRFGGIASTLVLVVTPYAMVSFLVMTIHAFTGISEVFSRIHWVIQILAVVIAVASALSLSITRATAITGQAFDLENLPTPKQLQAQLNSHGTLMQALSSKELGVNLKRFGETLAYSINENDSLAELSGYRDLCREVEILCLSLKAITGSSNEGEDFYDSMNRTVNTLTEHAKSISASQVQG